MNRYLLAGTSLYVRLTGGTVKGLKPVKLPNGHREWVVVFTKINPLAIGQLSPFHIIIIHQSVFQAKTLADYVIVHEYAHKQQWYGYFVYPMAIVGLPIALALLALALLFLIVSIAYLESAYFSASILFLAAAAIVTIFVCSFSWFLEFQADCRAIRTLRIARVLEAKDESFHIYSPGRCSRVIGQMLHPPITLTIRVCRKIHQDVK